MQLVSSETDGTPPITSAAAPLQGLRVIEFSHMVMGPVCGMVLADLGADVIKVEPPPDGDKSRRLTGIGLGFFATFNRNKRSVCVDVEHPSGLELVGKLISSADVFLENFRPGAMSKFGLDYPTLAARNPRLIYCACKGFLPGPYQHRAALDEVVQMMGGLAYMTGRPGHPSRAGASVNDIMGGVFGALAVLAALRQRDVTGNGSLVQSGLFETNMLFVAQHMARAAIEGCDPPPFGDPTTGRPWPIYDVFETADPGQQVFVGVVTDSQWRQFCAAFELQDLLDDPALGSTQARARARPQILGRVRPLFRSVAKDFLMAKLEKLGLPFAPIATPSQLFDDPHLRASGGLLPIDLTKTEMAPARPSAGLPALPVILAGNRPGLVRQPPRVGEHTAEIMRTAGLSDEQLRTLMSHGVLISSENSAVG